MLQGEPMKVREANIDLESGQKAATGSSKNGINGAKPTVIFAFFPKYIYVKL